MTADDKNVSSAGVGEDITGDGGVLKEILRAGTGDDGPMSGDKVFVHYVGTLASDGSQFDSSRDRGEKFEFTLGQGQVIKAWDVGVATMKRGELSRFTCRSEYAYGSAGSPPKIPADATLIFEVELFEWRGEDLSSGGDGGIIRRQLVKGTGYNTPNDGASVIVELRGSHEGRVFDERELTFTLGDGCDHEVCPGIEHALQSFKSGEKSQLTLSAAHAFGATGSDKFQIPANADRVMYEVTLKSFEKAKDKWEFDASGKLEQAKIFKEKGTTFFKADKFLQAEKNYKKVIDFLEFESGFSDTEKAEARDVELAAHLNLALCYLKTSQPAAARKHCDSALTTDPASVKALFRRGQALLALGEPQLAADDFRRLLQLQPGHRPATQQLQQCVARIHADTQREKHLYRNLFERMSKLEQKETPSKSDSELKIDHFANGDAPPPSQETDSKTNGVATENGSAEVSAESVQA